VKGDAIVLPSHRDGCHAFLISSCSKGILPMSAVLGTSVYGARLLLPVGRDNRVGRVAGYLPKKHITGSPLPRNAPRWLFLPRRSSWSRRVNEPAKSVSKKYSQWLRVVKSHLSRVEEAQTIRSTSYLASSALSCRLSRSSPADSRL